MPDKKLAIVIPAYKAEYFERTVASIAKQSDTRFTLYVGDDASADDLFSIVQKYKADIKIVYKRFHENMGGKSLVKQWERCIDLTHEEWIWLFGDDDIMPEDAVKSFYEFLRSGLQFDVARFDLSIIDHKGDVIYETTSHPVHETSRQFAVRVLERTCRTSASEFIFSRKVYRKTGGFVEFPLAWASDVATWIKFGMDNGIHTMPGAPVQWRLSGSNLSSRKDSNVWVLKLDACIDFSRFLKSQFDIKEDAMFEWMFFHFTLLSKRRRKLEKKLMQFRFIRKVATSKVISLPTIFGFYKQRKLRFFRRKMQAALW